MDGNIYSEKLASARTTTLFIVLTLIFFALFSWRLSSVGWNEWVIAFLCISAFFLFYVFNYRTLKIDLTNKTLRLTFGIFTWSIVLTNIESCYRDEDTILRFGGAGIHFMFIKGKYRAFFNFLEYSRVVIVLKKKKGPVREVAFSTKNLEQVMKLINSQLS